MGTKHRNSKVTATLQFSFATLVFAGYCSDAPAQTKSEPVGKRTAAIVSKIDVAVVAEFQKAWLLSGNGFDKTEVLVLLYRMANGSVSAKSLGRSGLSRQFSFPWTGNIIGVVHTHPNSAEPRPLGQDLQVADRFEVPVFTITKRGMFLYDPDTKKISLVQEGLDWLNSTKRNHDGRLVVQKR